ncbi:hypothetical protein K440DRAFT_610568 [Wilcoxina mikolae CBS 423.85]|nr:hypothetical protein K440DRAFT_610568 [Wilcoxina mikolae CBS 423.85]
MAYQQQPEEGIWDTDIGDVVPALRRKPTINEKASQYSRQTGLSHHILLNDKLGPTTHNHSYPRQSDDEIEAEDEDDDEDEETCITSNHDKVLEEFHNALKRGKVDVEDFMCRQPPQVQQNIGKKGTDGRTLLHKIFSQTGPKKFGERRILCKWIMSRYPELYRETQDDGRTILHIAAQKFNDGINDRVTFFIQEFTQQTSVLLLNSKLIHQIMPHIRKCDGKLVAIILGLPEDAEEDSNPPANVHLDDEHGNSVLHLAARYDHHDSPEAIQTQLRLVETVLKSCPNALKQRNKDGHSPYQYRLDTYFNHFPRAKDSDDIPLHDDKIAMFLKDKIMHIQDRDQTIRLLHGDVQEREIHLDLVELENRTYPVSRNDLEVLVQSLKFENILQYVQIPRYPFSTRGTAATSADDTETNRDGIGRRDFKLIFDLLHKKGVKKIIKLIVDDDEDTPHSDEIIEQLSCFEIEEWDWRKMDICSEVIRTAAPHVQQVFLYSSGNNSVLHGWSCSDGLNQLKNLREVHTFIRRRLESEERTKKYAADFKTRMTANCGPGVRISEPRIQKATGRIDQSWFPGSDKMATNAWLENMDKFVSFITNLPDEIKSQPAVRVAIIDDGIDSMQPGLKDSIEDGVTFYTQRGKFVNRTNPYYFSSTGHGTLMAQLVLRVCPKAQLYIARLNQGHSSSGSIQPTAESAAKAIRWAIKKRVHIISMSWTIEKTNKNARQIEELEAAIKEAHKSRILMFGAASDQGYNSSGKPYYPAKGTGVICIGAAKGSGHAEEVAEKDSDYLFPGGTLGIKLPRP